MFGAGIEAASEESVSDSDEAGDVIKVSDNRSLWYPLIKWWTAAQTRRYVADWAKTRQQHLKARCPGAHHHQSLLAIFFQYKKV